MMARQMLFWGSGTKLKLCDAPADITAARGSWSRDDKKAIKNGTNARLFTALSALFDVSLCFDLSDSTELWTATLRAGKAEEALSWVAAAIVNSRETPQNGNDVFREFVHHLLRILWRRFGGVDILGENRRNLGV